MGDLFGILGFVYLMILLVAWTLRIGLFLCFLGFWLFLYLPFALLLGLSCKFPPEIAALVGIETEGDSEWDEEQDEYQ